jgi:magnesium-transporting ATPase (P-type)
MRKADNKKQSRSFFSEEPHMLSAEQAVSAMDSSVRGLTSAEAARRLLQFGPNELPHAEPAGVLLVFVRQFANPLVYILLIAALISAAMRDFSDAGFILAVLLVNAAIALFRSTEPSGVPPLSVLCPHQVLTWCEMVKTERSSQSK